MNLKLCKICNKEYDYRSGYFTNHLISKHNTSLEDYVIKYELKSEPLCECGCGLRPVFNRGKFLKYAKNHRLFGWKEKRWIEDNGIPLCVICGSEINKFSRGIPSKYCSLDCSYKGIPGWNQETIKQNNLKKYGVENIMFVDKFYTKCKNSVTETYKNNKESIVNKMNNTIKEKYGSYENMLNKIQTTFKNTMNEKYGVDHPSQMEKNKIIHSKRMKENNPSFTNKAYNTKKYKDTNLYYQGSYELHFLELCQSLNIIDKVKNGNVYNYLIEDKDCGHRLLTDFSIDNLEIEIKSSWILNKQGGLNKINAKKRAVERDNKKYIFILDKNYDEFLKIIYDNTKNI